MPAALCEQEVVVDAGQAPPGHSIEVELWLGAQVQLAHHGGEEGGVLAAVAAAAVLLQCAADTRGLIWNAYGEQCQFM